MMRSILYNSNDLQKYCAYANCQRQIDYVKLNTSTNTPNQSQKMRYAKYIQQPRVTCTKRLTPLGEIVGE
jgi:hypothetical protein